MSSAPRGGEFDREQAEVAALATRVVGLSHAGGSPVENAAARGPAAGAIQPRSVWRRALWWITYLLAWAAVLGLAAVAVLRVVYHDGSYLLTWLNAFTRYVYLPAYLCLVWAIWQRRWLLMLIASAVVACHIYWMVPDVVRDRPFDPPAASAAESETGPTVRVFFANVYQMNRQYDAMFDEIAAADPDVIVFAEWGWAWHQAFKKSPLASIYVHGASAKQPIFGLVNVFSRLPLKNEVQSAVVGRLVRSADIVVGTQSLRLVALHGPRPMYAPHDYGDFWDQVIPMLQSASTPLLVVGDFNATQHSEVYERLQAAGLRSAHDDRSRGYATTWPNDIYWLPPIRIDQAFLSADVACSQIVEGRGRGSDHRPLVVDVAIRSAGGPAAATPAAGG